MHGKTSVPPEREETDQGFVLDSGGDMQDTHEDINKRMQSMHGELTAAINIPKESVVELGLLASTEALGVISEGAAAIGGEVGLDAILDTILGILSSLLLLGL